MFVSLFETKLDMDKLSDFAKLDTDRQNRSGFPEVIYCPGKADDHLVQIFKRLYELNHTVMGTRATAEQYELVKTALPEAKYNKNARIITVEQPEYVAVKKGLVAVCSAGTADYSVAEEAASVCEYFGCNVNRVYDVGVAGIHRLLDSMDQVNDANCVIAVAGMEGALASVVGGLVRVPVIAVPTSVGYGASFEGLAALLTMMNSCSNGISVVNIDNGYGAGYIAAQINRLAVGER